jgi:DNA invertase Pin-like site-specific DNA recombinase
MRLCAYLRVSSKGQIDAWGLDRQEVAIRQYAKAHGHKIVEWYRDEGVSGTIEAVDRPQLAEAIRGLGSKAEGILVADIDRLARSLMVQEAALAVIWRTGCKVFTATNGEVLEDDPEQLERALIRQVLGAVVQFEKGQAVKRMRGGMRAKAAAGRKATGSYAYGYRGEGKGRERDARPYPTEQAAVRRILALRRAGASYREICTALTDEGHHPKRAEQWLPMTIKRIYDRETKTPRDQREGR